MSLTAFLPTGSPQILPFIGTPGAGTVGHALVWSQSPQGFTLSPVTVGPDQFSGVLPIGKGGTGSNTGSITGTGALTFTAGGTNQGITLQPSGSGAINFGSTETRTIGNFNCQAANNSQTGFTVNLPPTESSSLTGIFLRKGTGYFAAINATSSPESFIPYFIGRGVNSPNLGISFVGGVGSATPSYAGVYFNSRQENLVDGVSPSGRAFYFENGTSSSSNFSPCLLILGNGNSQFFSTTESTSTTTGAIRVDGGLGVAKNANIGGNLKVSGGAINFALPTSNVGLAVGDLWRDGEIVKVKI